MKKYPLLILLPIITLTACDDGAYHTERADALKSELISVSTSYLSDLNAIEYAIDNLEMFMTMSDSTNAVSEDLEIEISEDDHDDYSLVMKEKNEPNQTKVMQGSTNLKISLLTSAIAPKIDVDFYVENDAAYAHFKDTSVLDLSEILLESYLENVDITFPENGKIYVDLSNFQGLDNVSDAFGVSTILNTIPFFDTPYAYTEEEMITLSFSLSKRHIAILQAEASLEAQGQTYKDINQTAFNEMVQDNLTNLQSMNLNYFYLDFHFDEQTIYSFDVDFNATQPIENQTSQEKMTTNITFETILLDKNEGVTINAPTDLNEYTSVEIA